MQIPVFGDIHGDIEGMFKALQRLQEVTDKRYPFVLQLGDLGYFPDPSKADDATRRRGEHGITDYLASSALHERFFVKPTGMSQLESKILFIRGNHEDHDELFRLASKHPYGVIPADDYNVLHYLHDGRTASLQSTPLDAIRIGALGGVAKDHRPKACERDPLTAFNERAIDDILNQGDIDVLLTHQGPQEVLKGDPTISVLIGLVKPRLHLHGHTHVATGPTIIDGIPSYGLARQPASDTRYDVPTFVGILESTGDTVTFSARVPRA